MSDSITSDLLHHARVLAEQIGPRMAGTPANHAAAEYVAGVFARAGLSVETLPFACPDWHCAETALELDGAALVAAANVPSPPCDLSAPTVAALHDCPLDWARPEPGGGGE